MRTLACTRIPSAGRVGAILLIASFTCGVTARATADRIRALGVTLQRTKTVTYTRYRLFDIFDASLHLEPGTARTMFPPRRPVHLAVTYHRGVRGRDLVKSANDILEDLHEPGTLARHRENLDAIHRVYHDVEEGDTYGITYVPGKGMELLFNGEREFFTEDSEFGAFYLSIWLGTHKSTRVLREAFVVSP